MRAQTTLAAALIALLAMPVAAEEGDAASTPAVTIGVVLDGHGTIRADLETPGLPQEETVVVAEWVDWPGTPPGSDYTYDPYFGWVRFWWGTMPRISTTPGDPAGGYCHWTQYLIYTTVAGIGAEWTPAAPAGYQAWLDAGNVASPCPGQLSIDQAVAGDRATIPDQLPRPAPYVQPDNQAVTGLPSYFVTNRGTQDWRSEAHTVSLGFQTITVRHEARVESWVDWKDGATAGPSRASDPWVTGPHDEAGLPWPNGTISFTYRDTGNLVAGMTDWWTIDSWVSVGGAWARRGSQTIDLVPVTVPVTIQQAQPVRNR